MSTATGESSDDLKSIKHIPSVTLVEEEDEAGAAAVALKEDRDPVMIMKNDIFNKYTPKVSWNRFLKQQNSSYYVGPHTFWEHFVDVYLDS